MSSYLRKNTGAVALSAGLHIAIAVGLTLGISFSDPPLYPPAGESVAIEATVVDEALIQREMARLEGQVGAGGSQPGQNPTVCTYFGDLSDAHEEVNFSDQCPGR